MTVDLLTSEKHMPEADLDIQEAVSTIINPFTDVREAREVFREVVKQAEWSQSDRFKYVHQDFVNGEAILPLIRDPYEGMLTEMQSLRQLSIGRTVKGASGLQEYELFVTRDATEQNIDSVYRTITSETQAPLITIESHLQGQLEHPCYFYIAQGALRVVRKSWSRGAWNYQEQPVYEGSNGERLLLGEVSKNLWAGHLAITRPSEKRIASDNSARDLAYTVL